MEFGFWGSGYRGQLVPEPAEAEVREVALSHSFQGRLKTIRRQGQLVYNEETRSFYHEICTVSLYVGALQVVSPRQKQLVVPCLVSNMKVRVQTEESGFWVLRHQAVEVMVQCEGEEYVFQVTDEAQGQAVLAWQAALVGVLVLQ